MLTRYMNVWNCQLAIWTNVFCDPFLLCATPSSLCARATHPSFLLVAYLAAQAYSIYYLVPRKTKVEPNKRRKSRVPCTTFRRCVSKIYKFCQAGVVKKISSIIRLFFGLQWFYEEYRFTLITIGLQIFEITSQMLAFVVYIWSVPTRLTRIQ